MSVISDLTSSRDLLVNLTSREIKGKYKRTMLGQVWSLINPIAVMVTYSVVFSFLLRAQPAPGNPSGLDVFALWLSCALLPWMFFNNVVSSGMGAIIANANLIQKVYFPRETILIANMLSWLFTFSIEMSVLIVAVFLFGGDVALYIPGVIFFMALLGLFSLGLSMMLAIANVYFRDTQHLVTIFMQVWFYVTPIVYPISVFAKKLPEGVTYYRLNPLERFSEVFRSLLYDGRWPSLENTVTLTSISVVSLVLGYWVFRRHEGNLAEEL